MHPKLLSFFYVSRLKEQSTHQYYILAVHDVTLSVQGDCRSSAWPHINNHQHLILLLLLLQQLKSLTCSQPNAVTGIWTAATVWSMRHPFFGTRNLNYTQSNFPFLTFIWVHNVLEAVHVQSGDVNTAHRNMGRSLCKAVLKITRSKTKLNSPTNFHIISAT
jgi:hypothetical protein